MVSPTLKVRHGRRRRRRHGPSGGAAAFVPRFGTVAVGARGFACTGRRHVRATAGGRAVAGGRTLGREAQPVQWRAPLADNGGTGRKGGRAPGAFCMWSFYRRFSLPRSLFFPLSSSPQAPVRFPAALLPRIRRRGRRRCRLLLCSAARWVWLLPLAFAQLSPAAAHCVALGRGGGCVTHSPLLATCRRLPAAAAAGKEQSHFFPVAHTTLHCRLDVNLPPDPPTAKHSPAARPATPPQFARWAMLGLGIVYGVAHNSTLSSVRCWPRSSRPRRALMLPFSSSRHAHRLVGGERDAPPQLRAAQGRQAGEGACEDAGGTDWRCVAQPCRARRASLLSPC